MTVLYAGLLARAALVGPADQPDRRGRLAPGAGLAGWTHYVVFDLFVGRWIWRTALEEGRGCRLALVLALFAGPLGLLVFDLQRRGAPRRSQRDGRKGRHAAVASLRPRGDITQRGARVPWRARRVGG